MMSDIKCEIFENNDLVEFSWKVSLEAMKNYPFSRGDFMFLLGQNILEKFEEISNLEESK